PGDCAPLKLLIRGLHAHRSVVTDPEHHDPQPFQRGPHRFNERVVTTAIRESDGCTRLALSHDREGLEYCLTDMNPHLRLVERLTKPRRVSLRAARALGLYFQSDSRTSRDDIGFEVTLARIPEPEPGGPASTQAA